MKGEIALTIAVFVGGIYMLALGYKWVATPGKKNSLANEEYFNKYRKIFRVGGYMAIIYAVLQVLVIGLR